MVQLYARDLQASLVRPVIELKGFTRVTLRPGQRKSVTFSLPVDMLGYTLDGLTRVVEPGEHEVMLGRSSQDIVFRSTVNVTGRMRTLGEAWSMMSEVRVEE